MTRTLIFIPALLAILLTTGGVAGATQFANTKWLNTKWLNTKWLNTADLNASNGGASFYNPWTGEVLPDVYLDHTSFMASYQRCDSAIAGCRIEEKRGDDFVGTWTSAVLGDGTPSYTYIAGRFHPPDAHPSTFLYWIYTWAPDDSGAWGWWDACHDQNGNATAAIPLAGEWDYRTGARVSYGGRKFTWACTSGALGKCAASGVSNTLGYAPWLTDYYPWVDPDIGMEYWVSTDTRRLHQACTRMIRADYCGDGTAHTIDGNAIDVRDSRVGGNRETEIGWAAEALWDDTGALWMSGARDGNLIPDGAFAGYAGSLTLTCATNNHVMASANSCFPSYLPTAEEVLEDNLAEHPQILANRTGNRPAHP